MADSIVAKFGGSSVRDDVAMLKCAHIVKSFPGIRVVILSATYNTTNELEQLADRAVKGQKEEAYELLGELKIRHLEIAEKLRASEQITQKLEKIFDNTLKLVNEIIEKLFITEEEMASLYSVGETISSNLFVSALSLTQENRNFMLINAVDLIATDSNFFHANPDIERTRENVKKNCLEYLDDYLIVTQGFIGSDRNKKVTTLGREGSDFSGALIAEAIGADTLQIWTDVPGVASADPRVFKNTKIIPSLCYKQAEVMASLGAKILFPRTMEPLNRKDIPLYVGSSREVNLGGTYIRNEENYECINSLNIISNAISLVIPLDSTEHLQSLGEIADYLETNSVLFIKDPMNFTYIFESSRGIDGQHLIERLGNDLDYKLLTNQFLISLVGYGLKRSEKLPTDLTPIVLNDYQASYLCDDFNKNFWQNIHDQLILPDNSDSHESRPHL